MIVTDKEERFIRYLGESFEKNRRNVTRELACQECDLTRDEYEPLMRMAESRGAVDNIVSASGEYAGLFTPTFGAVELARKIEKEEEAQRQPDFVKQIQRRFKQNPIAACVILLFLLLAVVAPIYGMIVDLCQRLDWLDVPK